MTDRTTTCGLRGTLPNVRIEYAGAFYPVMVRGIRRENILRGEDDQRLSLKGLMRGMRDDRMQIHAWVLMRNQYHVFVEKPEANLTAGMQWLQNAYTRRFNTRRRVWGALSAEQWVGAPTLSITARDHQVANLVNPVKCHPLFL